MLTAPGLIDSHCHLDFYEPAELPDILANAHAAGVTRMVTIGTRLAQAQTQIALAEAHDPVWATIGTHPHNAAEEAGFTTADLLALVNHRKIIGIGESGLDYHYETAPRDLQAILFRRHIAASRQTGLPLVIHTRAADADMLAILTEEAGQGAFPFLLHCFSSGPVLAHAAVALGGYISFSGILTFQKSQELRDLAAVLPIDRLLVETDSPYLAPVPFRGKRCQPAYVARTAAILAEARGLTPEAIAAQTTANFHRLFTKATPCG